jgi:hypothetical protein
MERAALGQVLCEYFGYSCHWFTPLTFPQSSPSITQGWYNRTTNGHSNSGLAPQINKSKIRLLHTFPLPAQEDA